MPLKSDEHSHSHAHAHDRPPSLDREDAPFLDAGEPSLPLDDQDDDSAPKPYTEERREIDRKIRFRLMVTLFAMILAVEVGVCMSNGPVTRIYESIACREYYAQYDPTQIAADGQVPEELCKIKAVQQDLAAVKGYMEFFDGILSAVLAIPYGLLADRRGRKSTICLSIPGFALNCIMQLAVMWFPDVFPLRAVWASSLAWLFGGGPVVAFAIIWTMMSDVSTEEERAAIFFRFGVASMGADFASSAASSWLMSLDPWLPLLIGWSLAVIGMFFALSLPETMHVRPVRSEKQSMEMSQVSPGDSEYKSVPSKEQEQESFSDDETIQGEVHAFAKTTTRRSFFAMIKYRLRAYFAPYSFILRNKQIMLLLTAFLVYRLSRGSSWFLVQYISTRFKWTLAEANFLMSFKPALTIPLFLFILPAISRQLLKSMKPTQKDLRLMRISIGLLAVGTLGIGLSSSVSMLIPSLVLQTSGSGFVFLTRSLITTLVNREETARLFTIIEVLQSVGNVIASLSITTVFQIGLEIGGPWIGLAWMMTATAFTMRGSGIAPFLPLPPPRWSFVQLPLRWLLWWIRLPLFIVALASYFLVLQWLPIGSLGRKACLSCILSVPSIWWIDIQVDGVQRGTLNMRKHQGRLPGPSSIIASTFTSPIDAVYLAAIFDPVFVAAYPDSTLVVKISLWEAILRSFASPQLRPLPGSNAVDFATVMQQYPGRPIVVFPECTTTNGRGVMPLSRCLTNTPARTPIYPVALRYTPQDVMNPIPGCYLSFLWTLLSRPTHCIRVRIAQAVVAVREGEDADIEDPDNTYLDTLDQTEHANGFQQTHVVVPENKVIGHVADSLARIGRARRVGLTVQQKREFVDMWRKSNFIW
ncbi:MFS general substrate transporter, partial [Aspergillus heteromorphus CBS 117.55]